MKTAPFNLEKALAGHPVVTKNGKRIQRIIHVPELRSKSIRVFVVDQHGGWWQTDEDGKYLSNYNNGEFDLFLEVKTVKRWARVLRAAGNRFPQFFCTNCRTREEAEQPYTITYGNETCEVLPAYEYEVEE